MIEDIKTYIQAKIPDERQQGKVVHKLLDIVIIVMFATLGNANDWVEIALWAKTNTALLLQYVELKNGVPSHDTIQRVMAMINPEVFRGLLQFWGESLNAGGGEKLKKLFAIDGKTIRGNGNKNQNALHIVSVWSKENGVCFGQRSEDSKGKEIPMIKDLLDTMSVAGHIVTIDAIETQKEIAQKIAAGKADYVLAVKENQKNLYNGLVDFFKSLDKIEDVQYYKEFEKARGRLETREYYQSGEVSWLRAKKRNGEEKKEDDKENWPKLKSIGMVVNTYENIDSGEKTIDNRYYISSLEANVEELARAVRGHWSVESMHRHLDVTFGEDKNRTLETNAAENLNIVRKWSLSTLNTADLGMKLSMKKKRFLISCDSATYIQRIMEV
ncbi:ISAs1 family transposase [Breznakiellaceae bacterium SP9]